MFGPELLSLVILQAVARVSALPALDESNQTPLSSPHGAVASESIICSTIGIELLERGVCLFHVDSHLNPAQVLNKVQGNAADAHVGTQLCVGVMGMYHSGIGGGGFALVRDAHGNYETIDYREQAPAAASENMYKGNLPGSVVGGLAVAIPGDLKGLQYLHQKHGVCDIHPRSMIRNFANIVCRSCHGEQS